MSALKNLNTFFTTHPLTRDAPFRAWGRFFSWQVRSRLKSDIVFPWIDGQKLAVRRGMQGATGNIYAGLHEFADMALTLHFLRRDDLFLDIGANVGSYTVLASGVSGATSWAFEPDPDTARALKHNIALNNLNDLATVYEFALGDTEGKIRFTVGLDSINKVATEQEENARSILQKRLDDVVGLASPAMIKLDVEGYEEHVLRGATNVIGNASLKLLEIETVTPWIIETLSANRFERAFYDPFNRRLTRQSAGITANNTLFVRDWDFVSERLESAKKIKVLGHEI